MQPAAALIWNKNQLFMYILYSEYIVVSVVNLQKSNEIGKKLHFIEERLRKIAQGSDFLLGQSVIGPQDKICKRDREC